MNTQIKKAEVLKYICLVLSYAFSYAYVNMISEGETPFETTIYMVCLSAAAVIWLELTMKQQEYLGRAEFTKTRRYETRFWEVILMALSVSTYFGMRSGYEYLFIHLVVIYMVACGTGHLLRGESSCVLPFDMINSSCRIAFANFPARIFSIYDTVKLRREESGNTGKKTNWVKVLIVLGVIGLCIGIFGAALANLAALDENFQRAADIIAEFIRKLDFAEEFLKFMISIPIGAFLFGMFQGSIRFQNSFEKRTMKSVDEHIGKVAVVPHVLFSIIMGIFIVTYIVFYISQATYMFSAFQGVLPEEFTASRYAVEGFYELINVVLINFTLLALVRLFCVKDKKIIKVMSVILMIESMIFASISASKIILYMTRFGYTEARTLGLWGTIVVFVGAILAIVNIVTGKKTFKYWFWFSAVSFVVINFIAYPFMVKGKMLPYEKCL